MCKVSVLIPVYNAERYLKECLESIRKQIFIEYEVIIVDDGSTDKSSEIYKEFIEMDSRFKAIYQENQGAGIARNVAINHAFMSESEYIVWVDADDVISPDYLSVLYEEIIKNNEYDIIQCDYSSDDVEFKRSLEAYGGRESRKYDSFHGQELLYLMQNGKYGISFNVLWNKIYKKSIYNDVRVHMDDCITGKINNDVNMLWRLYINSGNCLWVHRLLYFYRIVPGSIQHRKIDNRRLEALFLYTYMYHQLEYDTYAHFLNYLSERILFFFAFNLKNRKSMYKNYNEFYNLSEETFEKISKQITFSCKRIDIKILNFLGKKNFYFFRIYGRLYQMRNEIKEFI